MGSMSNLQASRKMSKSIVSSNIHLRPYQQDFIDKVLALLFTGKKVLGQLPTQSGKTICFALIAQEFIKRNPDSSVLVVAHRRELVKQACDKIGKITNEPVGKILSGLKPESSARYQVASIGSIARRQEEIGTPGLIIVDECHHVVTKSYQDIISRFPNALLLGVTATPIRLDGIGFKETFDELVNGEQTKELIVDEYLSSYRYFAAPDPMSTEGCGTKDGDFTIADIERVNNIVNLSANIVDSYLKHANGKQSIVFTVSVAFAQEIAARFNSVGIPAAVVHGKQSSKQRDLEIEKFRCKINKVLVNCQLIDEGFSVPSVECVQIARPTKSLVRQLQSIGRGMAIEDGKSELIIIDHTQNYQRFGLPDLNRIWSLNGVSSENIVLYRTPDREIVGIKDSLQVVENELVELVEIDRAGVLVLSNEDVQNIIDGTKNCIQLGEEYGVTGQTIGRSYKRQTGKALRSNIFVLTDEDINKLKDRVENSTQMSKRIGVNISVLYKAYKRQTGKGLGEEVFVLSHEDIQKLENRTESAAKMSKRLGAHPETVRIAYSRQTGKLIRGETFILPDEYIEKLKNGSENSIQMSKRIGVNKTTVLNAYKRQTGQNLGDARKSNIQTLDSTI